MQDISKSARSQLDTHMEEDEDEEVEYAAKGGNGTAARSQHLPKPDTYTQSNLYTFTPTDLKHDMDQMKDLLHLKP